MMALNAKPTASTTYTIKLPSIHLGLVQMQNKEAMPLVPSTKFKPRCELEYKIGEAQRFLLIHSKILNKQNQAVGSYTKCKSYKCELK